MTRIIKIENCTQCPSFDHRGAFGDIAYIPVCRSVNLNLTYSVSSSNNGRKIATPTGAIPEWCPLEKLEG